jgi:hypothetical protein
MVWCYGRSRCSALTTVLALVLLACVSYGPVQAVDFPPSAAAPDKARACLLQVFNQTTRDRKVMIMSPIAVLGCHTMHMVPPEPLAPIYQRGSFLLTPKTRYHHQLQQHPEPAPYLALTAATPTAGLLHSNAASLMSPAIGRIVWHAVLLPLHNTCSTCCVEHQPAAVYQ